MSYENYVIIIFLSADITAECDPNDSQVLIYNEYTCFKPSPYSDIPWSTSRDFCESAGSHLAFIKNNATQVYLETNLPEPTTIAYWIGAIEAKRWKWDYSKEFFLNKQINKQNIHYKR